MNLNGESEKRSTRTLSSFLGKIRNWWEGNDGDMGVRDALTVLRQEGITPVLIPFIFFDQEIRNSLGEMCQRRIEFRLETDRQLRR